MKTLKNCIIALIFLLTATNFLFAQEKFDIVTFSTPKDWQKLEKPNAVQFVRQVGEKDTFATMMLFMALPSGNDSKANFNASWETLVKETFNAGAPQMQPMATENGWIIETGLSQIENNGGKAMAMLVSATGGGKVVNLVVITDTDKFNAEIAGFLESLVLPKITTSAVKPAQSIQNPASPRKSYFKYNTSNFDNGWTAVEENDWVRATKSTITVLLHYPHPREKETFYELEKEARTFWDLLIAPRYGNLSNFEVLRSDRDFEPARFAAGNVTENATGKKVYVALFSKHGRGWVEVIAPDKASFAKEFGAININDEIINWKPLLALFGYNKFAVDAADLPGKWISNFAGTTQYASIYTGRYIGAVTTVSATSYDFAAGNSYNYRTDGASSSGGQTDFSKAESSGKFSLPTNWEIRFSDIEGRPQTYPIHFSCIRGARVLWVAGMAYGQVN